MAKLRAPKVEQLGKPEKAGPKKFLKRQLRRAIRRTDKTEKPLKGYRGYST